MMETNSARGWQRARTIATGLLACICSVAQLALAEAAASYARHTVSRFGAELPLPVTLLLPVWRFLSRTPWELCVVALYALLTFFYARGRRGAGYAMFLLWLSTTTACFVTLWFLSLLMKVCCI
jgi:uncharacterized membrane protein